MPTIPAAMLKQLYRRGSLCNTATGWEFTMRNHLASANLTGFALTCDSVPVPPEAVTVAQPAQQMAAAAVSPATPLRFTVGVDTVVQVAGPHLSPGPHTLSIRADTHEIGAVTIAVQDTVAGDPAA